MQIDRLVGIEGAATSVAVLVPFDCELVLVAYGLTAVADADLTFDVLVNNQDVNVDLQIPDTTQSGVGSLTGRVSMVAGDTIALKSNLEQTAATNMDSTIVIRPT